MAKLDEVYQSDPELAENGAWVTLRPGGKSPLRIKIRSAHSRVARREEMKLDKKYRVQYMAGNGQLDPETQDEREVLLIAKGLLVGWENFEGDDGQPLVYKHDVVVQALKAYPQLRREILFLARTDDNFRPERIEAERDALAKN